MKQVVIEHLTNTRLSSLAAGLVGLDHEAARRSEVAALRKQLGQLLWVKTAYAVLILFCVLSLSKLALGSTLQGLALALVIRASSALTIDNFIERTCQRTLRTLEPDPRAS